ncbi:MAG: trypsin-like peptidase domain-containing protein [Crocosphaera sp.]
MMTLEKLQESIVLITSKEPDNRGFGTGFVVKSQWGISYIVTCAHVVTEIGGEEFIQVDGKSGIVIVSGEETGLDLAVVRVEGLTREHPLKLGKEKEVIKDFLTAGYHGFQQSGTEQLQYFLKPSQGEIGNPVIIQSQFLGKRIQGWDLNIVGENGLQRGCSGSPIVEPESGEVIAVASHRQGEKKGLALAIEELENIWKFVDSEKLYKTLVKLGYQKQVKLFQKLIKSVQTAALLIHGPPEYGQKWLLNLLLKNHLEDHDLSLYVIIELDRRGRKLDKSVLTRELCRQFHVDPKKATLEEIAKKIEQCLESRNVIIIFHNVDYVGGENVRKILEKLWQPLLMNIKKKEEGLNKLFFFLVDYEGKIGESTQLFQEKIEKAKEEYYQLKIPKLREFSESDLLNWSTFEREELPEELVEEIDEEVDTFLEETEGGIPVLTLDEICARCDLNWFQESKKWLSY